MPNRRGITGPGPADSTADVVFMHDDVAERGFHPCGFGHMVQLCGRVGPGGQDLGDVIVAEPGDLGCRLRIGKRPCRTPARPVLGDCRQMRHTSRIDQPGQSATAVLHAASSSPVTNAMIRSIVS